MRALTRGIVLVSFFVLAGWCATAVAQGQPDGQLTVAFDASIAPAFLDPAETPGIGTPFVFLYALHDALIKPLPGNDMAPVPARSPGRRARTGSSTSSSCARVSSSTTAIRSRRRT